MSVKCYFLINVFTVSFLIAFIILPADNFAQTATLNATLSVKEINGINIPYQNGFALPSFEKQNRKILNLQGEWKKQRFSADDNISLAKRDFAGYQNLVSEAAGRNNSSYDDSGWEIKTIPGVENQIRTYPNVPEFYEEGVWYRKSFSVDAADSGKFVKLMFYSVNYVADVWLNDVYLGYHEGGYTPFAFDVSSALNCGGNNVIVVRVDNPAWNTRNDIVPYTKCDWFNYTGIIHDVYLEFTSPVSVIRNDIVPLNLQGDIQSTIVINNIRTSQENVDVSIKIYEASIDSGNIQSEFAFQLAGTEVPVAGTNQNSFSIPADSVLVWRTSLSISNPKLWSPGNPNLYIAKVTITQGSDIIDEYSTQFGIRTVSTNGNKFLLNNKVVFLTGAARHEDHPLYGRSVPPNVIYNDLQIVKSLNINFLRTAHYPNHLYTYLIADRLGIVTMQEIPVFWFDTETAWQIQNNFRHIHEQMFKEMIFKDYNRPSVVLWSTCNECLDVSNRKIFIEKVNQDLDTNYPDGRLVTQSAAADRPGANDDSQNACDISGWTMYFGIFHGSTYFTGTYNFINDAKAYNPNKPIIDTEFGYWSSENGSSEQKQVEVFTNTFLAFKQHAALTSTGAINVNGPLMASTWWCVFDWYRMSSSLQTMGLYSMDRTYAKPVATTLKNSYAQYFNFDGVTDVNDEITNQIPESFELSQNYPNPFNPSTKIRFEIPGQSRNHNVLVTLKVFDILGNEIVTLVNEYKPAGKYEVEFNLAAGRQGAVSGVYFYQLKAGDFVSTKKMVLLK
jgi:beta-glucuronidase